MLAPNIGEMTDLASAEPAKLAELKGLLEAKYQEVRNEAPAWPAWNFTGADGRKIVWPDYAKKRVGK